MQQLRGFCTQIRFPCSEMTAGLGRLLGMVLAIWFWRFTQSKQRFSEYLCSNAFDFHQCVARNQGIPALSELVFFSTVKWTPL